jgi:hypothetical protein
VWASKLSIQPVDRAMFASEHSAPTEPSILLPSSTGHYSRSPMFVLWESSQTYACGDPSLSPQMKDDKSYTFKV